MTKSRRAPVSREAAEADVVGQTAPGAMPESVSGDAPMPTAENAPPYQFVPSSGCSILDVHEIVLMFILSITRTKLDFPAGAIRNMTLPADHFAKLSPDAQRFMHALAFQEPEAPKA